MLGSKVVFIMHGTSYRDGRPGISGGDIRLVEIAARLPQGWSAELFGSEAAAELCRSRGVAMPTKAVRDIGEVSLLQQVAKVIQSVLFVPWRRNAIAYSSCEHLYDVLPAALMKLMGNRWVAVNHWVQDSPFKNVRGNTPLMPRLIYHLNRVLSQAIMRSFADLILAVSSVTEKKLVDRGWASDQLSAVDCGVDLGCFEYSAKVEKRYDAVYIKRLDYGKGAFDLVQIWRKVVDRKPDAKLVVVGDGSPRTMTKLSQMVDDLDLKDAIEFTGPIQEVKRKLDIMSAARLMVLPSHEENWAIVIGEGLALGLPVIAYDLPEIRPIWRDSVQWVQFGAIEGFAEEVLRMLSSEDEIRSRSAAGRDYVRSYSWEHVAAREYAAMTARLQ